LGINAPKKAEFCDLPREIAIDKGQDSLYIQTNFLFTSGIFRVCQIYHKKNEEKVKEHFGRLMP